MGIMSEVEKARRTALGIVSDHHGDTRGMGRSECGTLLQGFHVEWHAMLSGAFDCD